MTQTMNRAARTGADEARGVAQVAAERGGELAESAREETRELADTVRERAQEVTGELAEQSRQVAEQTRDQLEAKAAAATQQLASGFRDLGQQAQALAEGRPEDAPTITEAVCRAADGLYGTADRLYALSADIEQGGIGSALDDLQSFARRRPGAFLLGAAALGFGVGRVVKAEKERREYEGEQGGPQARAYNGSTAVRRTSPRAVR